MGKHPDVIAWEKWESSDEGKRCLDISTIGGMPSQTHFLENRLLFAFNAGIASQAKKSAK